MFLTFMCLEVLFLPPVGDVVNVMLGFAQIARHA